MSAEPTWTPEREAALREDFTAGLSCDRSAKRMGVTRNMVIAKRWRLGLIMNPLGLQASPQQRERARSEHHALAYWAAHRSDPKGCATDLPEIFDPADDPSSARTCAELRDWHCKWPLERTQIESDHLTPHCGKPRVRGSYCAVHAERAYVCEEAA